MSIGFSLPPSKSQTMRALIFALLGKGKSVIENPLFSPDTTSLLHGIEILGGKVSVFPEKIEVEGSLNLEADDVIYAGNSGIIFRFLTALVSLSSTPAVITGDDSIRNRRPIAPLLEGLKQLGVSALSLRKQGGAPIFIQGPMQGGKTTVLGEDSQIVSSLLIASSHSSFPTHIEVKNPGEKPWVDMTLSWFDRLGISYRREGYDTFYVPGKSTISPFFYKVPPDHSSALFPIIASLITQIPIHIPHFTLDPFQGDKKCLDLLIARGANIFFDNETLIVKKTPKLHLGTIDVNPFIDSLPILSTLACFSEGETKLIGAHIARTKECDRIAVMAQELKKMGAHILEEADTLTITPTLLKPASLNSHNDHRVAMSLFIASLPTPGTTLTNTACISKTYPTFLSDFSRFS